MSVQLNDPLYVDAEDSQGNKRTAPNRGFLITNKMMTIGLVLLALNLLATLGLIVAFGAFAIGAQNAMHDANKTAHDLVSGMGLLPQISKMVRTNLDLTTWSSFFQDASDRLGQVANGKTNRLLFTMLIVWSRSCSILTTPHTSKPRSLFSSFQSIGLTRKRIPNTVSKSATVTI